MDFLTYEVIPTLMETVGVSQYYGVKEVLRDTYFEPGEHSDGFHPHSAFLQIILETFKP